MRKWMTDFCTNCAKNFCCTCECTDLKLYNYKQQTRQKIIKPYHDKIVDAIEKYICDEEEDTVKAQGACRALELIEAAFKELDVSERVDE